MPSARRARVAPDSAGTKRYSITCCTATERMSSTFWRRRQSITRPCSASRARSAYLRAEIVYAVTHEGALHLDDIMARRTRMVYEYADEASAALDEVAEISRPPSTAGMDADTREHEARGLPCNGGCRCGGGYGTRRRIGGAGAGLRPRHRPHGPLATTTFPRSTVLTGETPWLTTFWRSIRAPQVLERSSSIIPHASSRAASLNTTRSSRGRVGSNTTRCRSGTTCERRSASLLTRANLTYQDIACVGVTNQRETTVVWTGAGHPCHQRDRVAGHSNTAHR